MRSEAHFLTGRKIEGASQQTVVGTSKNNAPWNQDELQ